MTTAHDLLMNCPDDQTRRCQIVFKAISEGRWADAAFTLRNAISEVADGVWKMGAIDLAAQCEARA